MLESDPEVVVGIVSWGKGCAVPYFPGGRTCLTIITETIFLYYTD